MNMSDDTTQLIQLILNSVLMVLACTVVLGGLLLRRSVLENRVQLISIEYFQRLNQFEQPNRLLMLKKQVRYLQQRVKSANNGILVLSYALMLFVASTLTLAIRTVFSADWLVVLAMALFIAGSAIVLFSVAIVLLDLHRSERPFWHEVRDLLMPDAPKARRRIKKLRGVRAPHRVMVR